MNHRIIKAAFIKSIPVLAGYVALQIWKRNALVSILAGTVIYMLLVQVVF